MRDRPVPVFRAASPDAAHGELLGEIDATLRSGPVPWSGLLRKVRDGLRDGTFEGRVAYGSDGSAIGLAGGSRSGALGRRAWIILRSDHRSPEAVAGIVDALAADRPEEGPLLSFELVTAPVDGERTDERLVDAGYRPVVRADHRFPEGAALPGPFPEDPRIRPVRAEDEPLLARLLERAYAGDPVERALFLQSVDPSEDARIAVADLLHGRVGKWLPGASFGCAVDDGLVGATMAQSHDGQLISEVMVDPDHRRHGIAQRLLVRTLSALRARSAEPIRLVVTRSNRPAVTLYRRLGFVPDPSNTGTVWLAPRAIALARND